MTPSHSPHVIATHLYARFGYDAALQTISQSLTSPVGTSHQVFWKQVVQHLNRLDGKVRQQHPCSPLDLSQWKPAVPAPNPQGVRFRK